MQMKKPRKRGRNGKRRGLKAVSETALSPRSAGGGEGLVAKMAVAGARFAVDDGFGAGTCANSVAVGFPGRHVHSPCCLCACQTSSLLKQKRTDLMKIARVAEHATIGRG